MQVATSARYVIGCYGAGSQLHRNNHRQCVVGVVRTLATQKKTEGVEQTCPFPCAYLVMALLLGKCLAPESSFGNHSILIFVSLLDCGLLGDRLTWKRSTLRIFGLEQSESQLKYRVKNNPAYTHVNTDSGHKGKLKTLEYVFMPQISYKNTYQIKLGLGWGEKRSIKSPLRAHRCCKGWWRIHGCNYINP